MENSNVEENVKLLMKELSVLMRISSEGGEDENNRWSRIVKSSELEVHNMCNTFYELKKGPNPKKMIAERQLNTRVKQVWKYVKCLQECVNVQRLQREQESDKPKMYSCGELESFTAAFSIQIGAGGFAKVYKGQFPDGTEIAVKLLEENDVVLDMFLAELSTMGRISHPYLVKLYGYCFEKKKKALVYEYMKNGSFDEILYGNPLGLDWKKFYEIAVNIAEGLSHLHHDCPETIIHYDIKPANVLIDSNLSPKITDFGLAKFMNQCLTHLTNTGLKGTANFIAPEMVYPGYEVNEKCDVYSFGMVLFEILEMKRLDRSKGWFPREVYKKLKAGELDQVLEACSISPENSEDAGILSVVALWCIQFKPTARPSMSKVVKMLKKLITLLNPPDPFLQFAESSVPTIQEEIYAKPSAFLHFAESSGPTIQEEVNPKSFTSPSDESLRKGNFEDKEPLTSTNVDVKEKSYSTNVGMSGMGMSGKMVGMGGMGIGGTHKSLAGSVGGLGGMPGSSGEMGGMPASFGGMGGKMGGSVGKMGMGRRLARRIMRRVMPDQVEIMSDQEQNHPKPSAFLQFAESSWPNIQEEVYPESSTSPPDESLCEENFEDKEPLTSTNFDPQSKGYSTNVGMSTNIDLSVRNLYGMSEMGMMGGMGMMEMSGMMGGMGMGGMGGMGMGMGAMGGMGMDGIGGMMGMGGMGMGGMSYPFGIRNRGPPEGEYAAVVYTTSDSTNQRTISRCKEVLSMLRTHQVELIERDVHIDPKMKMEMTELMGEIELPAVFVNLRFVGGADEVGKMEEGGQLKILFEEVNRLKAEDRWKRNLMMGIGKSMF